MKVGIVGCGKIADQHAEIIQRIPGCEIVGVCDQEILMAKQMHERFNIKRHFTDVKQLLEESKPDVVHITTPPRSHFELSKTCMEAGCHVYVEKPFTVNVSEAEHLVEYAQSKNLKLTVGHNYQFTHAARSMRQLVADGFLGGPPIHMESYYCYNLGDTTYAKAVLGDKNHWVRKLPGRLLQNIISHGISKITEFMVTSNPTVIAHGFTSPLLRSMNETDIIDELRVVIYDGDNTTAYFTFSSQLHPVLHQLRLYGKVNGLEVDDDHETLVKLRGTKYKSYVEQFLPPIIISKEYLTNACGNMKNFATRKLYMDSGLRHLIQQFYHSIDNDAPLPIPYREIILTSRIMDSIFEQLGIQKRIGKAV